MECALKQDVSNYMEVYANIHSQFLQQLKKQQKKMAIATQSRRTDSIGETINTEIQNEI